MDHIIVIIFVLAYPAWAGYRFRQVRWGNKTRSRAYLESAAGLWAVVGLVILYTLVSGGDLAALGLVVPFGWKMFVSILIAIAVVMFFVYQTWGLTKSEAAQDAVRSQIRRISPILPRSVPQLGSFALLAITAGICEEILFRGYLIGYLQSYSDLWTALLVSSLMFGLAHAYQGPRGVLQSLVAGLIFGLLYLFSGSLLVPILLHITVDIHGGWAGYYASTRKAL